MSRAENDRFHNRIASHFGEVPDVAARLGSLRGWVARQTGVLTARYPGTDWEPEVWDAAYFAAYTHDGPDATLPRWAAYTLRWRVLHQILRVRRRRVKGREIDLGDALELVPDPMRRSIDPAALDGLSTPQAESLVIVAGLDGAEPRTTDHAAHVLGRSESAVRETYRAACRNMRAQLTA